MVLPCVTRMCVGEDESTSAPPGDKGWERWRRYGPLKLEASIRANYVKATWSEANETVNDDEGELMFNTATLGLDLDSAPWSGSAQYRYYRDKHLNDFYHMLHHCWLGYSFDADSEVRVGVHLVPFGALPLASYCYYSHLQFNVGLEDDRDLGVKFIKKWQGWDLRLGYYLQDEGHYRGDSDDSARYGADPVSEGDESYNKERNQLNARLAYTFVHTEACSTELGGSGQWSQIYNEDTGDNGRHYALALHTSGNYGPWTVILETVRYEFNLENEPGKGDYSDGSAILFGGYDYWYYVASKGVFYSGSVTYTLPLDRGPLDALVFYDDYSVHVKDDSDFANTEQNVVGVALEGGPFYATVEWISGRRHAFVGGDEDGFASGGEDNEWHTLFVINFGLYF